MSVARRLTVYVASFACVAWATTAAAAAQDDESQRQQTWRLTLELDAPGLVPEAVQYVIFDHDPIAKFKDNLKRGLPYHQQRLAEAKGDDNSRLARSIYLSVHWDLLFDSVTGARVYLLAGHQRGADYSITSNSPAGKKWVVTKVRRVQKEPLCWCLPVETKLGEEVSARLTSDNAFDLQAVYREITGTPEPEGSLKVASSESAASLGEFRGEVRLLRKEIARLQNKADLLERRIDELSPEE